MLLPLAVDAARGWMLLPDGGPRLRDLAADDVGTTTATPGRLLPDYAELQRTVEDRADALVVVGVPDERPERLVAVLDRLVGSDAIWARLDADDIEQGAGGAGSWWRRGRRRGAGGDLATSGFRPSIEHGDLHGGNILAGAEGFASRLGGCRSRTRSER